MTVAVIGHVDHGKTALVKALTGFETDRLKEEQERGLSIVLGFASRLLSGGRMHFVDAPGHADFVRTTASGVSGADAVLLVVSGGDGIALQTREHLKLASFFGIRRLTVALSKSDQVEQVQLDELATAVTELAAEFAFNTPSVTACSAKTGDGLEDLVKRLEALFDQPDERNRPAGIFLPIDRSFSVPGAGTVVTGTLLGGPLHPEDEVCLAYADEAATVRGIQISGVETHSAPMGARVAVNLRGVDVSSIQRGDTLYDPHLFQHSERIDVALKQNKERNPPIKHMQHVMVLMGTSAIPARIRRYTKPDANQCTAGMIAQLEFQSPQMACTGQRFVLRNPASSETLMGGVVLDANAPRITRNKSEHLAVLEASLTGEIGAISHALSVRDHGCVDLKTLSRLSHRPIAELPGALDEAFEFDASGSAFSKLDVSQLQTKYLSTLRDLHLARPHKPHIAREYLHNMLRPSSPALIAWVESGLLRSSRIRDEIPGVAMADHDPIANLSADQSAALQELERHIYEMALHPTVVLDTDTPDLQNLSELLVWQQRAIRFYNHSLKQGFLLHTEIVTAARTQLAVTFAKSGPFTTGAARYVLATNRKTIVPLLEYFDRIGATRRIGNTREIVDFNAADAACVKAVPD